VSGIIARGSFLKGAYTTELEQRLSAGFENRPVLGVANGTDALYLALCAAGVAAGSGVVTVANAGGYTTGATLRLGGRPLLVDVDRANAQMSADSLVDVLASHSDVAVVVLTHLYGLVGDVERIQSICSDAGVTLIEDCAQSIGAIVGGRPAGTFGQLATLSFYPTKNLGAFGDGGAVVCATRELHDQVQSLAQYGWVERYEVTHPFGINSRIDEIQAAVLLELEPLLASNNQRRREIVAEYGGAISGERYFIADESPRFVGHLAVMVTPTREADAAQLGAAGIGTGVHYPIPDHLQLAWRDSVSMAAALPVTEWLAGAVLTVPCFPGMTDEEVASVATVLASL